MDLEKKFVSEIDFNLLKEGSNLLIAKNLMRKFEEYYGKIPTEDGFYKIYLKYLKCQTLNGKVFNSSGTLKKSALYRLNSNAPKFILKQFQVIEEYLLQKKIINEKIFETDK